MNDFKKFIDDILNKNSDKGAIYKLSELYDKNSNQDEIEAIEDRLKNLLIPYKNGSIGLAQINPIAGDIEYNAKKIVKYIKHSQNIGLDIVVFPELVLMGYPIEDTIDRHPIIVEENLKWLKQIAKITKETAADRKSTRLNSSHQIISYA